MLKFFIRQMTENMGEKNRQIIHYFYHINTSDSFSHTLIMETYSCDSDSQIIINYC